MTVEVDPYEALIKLALSDDGIVDAVDVRVDIWHHYGQDSGDWSLAASSLIFVPAGGPMNQDDNVQDIRVEARCYGDSPYACNLVWKAVLAWSRNLNERRVQAVTEGSALIYYVLPLEHPRLFFDEDIRPNGGMPYFAIPIQAKIHGLTVTT